MSTLKKIKETWELYRDRTLFVRVQKTIGTFLDIHHLHLNESVVTNNLALAVGLCAGFSSVGYRYLIGYFRGDFFPTIRDWITEVSSIPFTYSIILIPAIGGLLLAPIIVYFAREASGAGVPEVIESVALRGGRLRFRAIWLKALVSAICIGSGGSAGRHGPMVYIGSSIGAAISNLFHMSTERRKWLVACGAAGGIAATFNAPIAGVLFAMEVILKQATLKTVTSIVLASVSASVVGHYYFGDIPAFKVPVYELLNYQELFFYAVMGVLGGFVALLFSNTSYFITSLFNKLKVTKLLQPAIGGLLTGFILLGLPQVGGVGYDAIEDCIRNNYTVQLLLLLIVGKILATSFTIGSGGSGGVFGPSLFIGAMFGGAFGYLIPHVYSGPVGPPGAYALVGMATVFAGTARAPLTAIIIMLEMTDDYSIILPLMFSVVISSSIANHFQSESIYTYRMAMRGTKLFSGHDLGILSSLRAKDVMITDIETLPKDFTIAEFKAGFSKSSHHAYPILDEKNELYGILTYNDYFKHKDGPDDTKMSEICARRLVTVNENDDLKTVLSKFMPRGVRMIMVVAEDNPKDLVGILTRTNIFDAYRIALKQQSIDGENLIDIQSRNL